MHARPEEQKNKNVFVEKKPTGQKRPQASKYSKSMMKERR
jgi:hypothetical protein